MSIQPLSNNTLPAYTPEASSKAASETPASQTKRAAAHAPETSRPADVERPNPPDDKDALRHATQKANQAIEGLRSDLKFTIDEETGINVVKFIDVKTKEVIRQIPAQEMLVIAKRLDELRGLLIKEQA